MKVRLMVSEKQNCWQRILSYLRRIQVVSLSTWKMSFFEQLAKDLELFAQHAGRKSVNMEDVILSAHRNEHLASLLRCFCNKLKAKEPQFEKKRKKGPRKDDKAAAAPSVLHIPEYLAQGC